MRVERWSQVPHRLPLLFLAVTLIPALALAWLTSELVERDRRLEKQQVQDRVENAADRIVAASHQRLSELESQLRRLAVSERDAPPDHTVLVVAEGDLVRVAPAGRLVYYPVLPKTSQPPRGVFDEGERYEHQQGNPTKAIDWFRSLARSEDPALRAGALLRLGRNQRKAGQIDAALATYAELATLGATAVEGFPAAMLALEARCRILEKAGRRAELVTSAQKLRTSLATGVWPLLRDAYDSSVEEARRWTGEEGETERDRNARAIAAAFQSTYERWIADGVVPQRQWLVVEGRPVLMASEGSQRRLVTLVAGAEFLQRALDPPATP